MEQKETFWEKVKGFFANVVRWLKGASSKTDVFITKYAPIGVDVLNWIKDFNSSESANIIETVLESVGKKYGAAFIPIVRKWLTKNLPKIIDALNLANSVANQQDINAKIIAGKDAINAMQSDLKATTLASIASMLANDISDDGKLSVSEAIAIIGYVYENRTNLLN